MAKLTFLGTGTSQGVPMIGCDCHVCSSEDPRDKRLRSSAFVQYKGLDILVDAGPDFRQQMLRAGIHHIDAILLTHNHKDHTGGLDDVRAFNYIERAPIRIYCEKYVEDSLRMEYSYAFAEKRYPGVPEWQITNIDEHPFSVHENMPGFILVWKDGKGYEKVRVTPEFWAEERMKRQARMGSTDTPGETGTAASGLQPAGLGQAEIIPVRGRHYMLPVLGYRFGKIAYLTDMNYIPEEEFDKLQGLEHFIINCVRRGRHLSHFSLPEAIETARKVGAAHTWLTHLSHQLPCYTELCAELPPDIQPAYDGLTIESGD